MVFLVVLWRSHSSKEPSLFHTSHSGISPYEQLVDVPGCCTGFQGRLFLEIISRIIIRV
jgi:hypothetical protein